MSNKPTHEVSMASEARASPPCPVVQLRDMRAEQTRQSQARGDTQTEGDPLGSTSDTVTLRRLTSEVKLTPSKHWENL